MDLKLVVASMIVAGLSLGLSSTATAHGSAEAEELVVDARSTDRDAAVNEFTRRFIWSEDMTVFGVDRFGQRRGGTATSFYQGRYKKPLEGADFYETVGRTDLANDFRRNNNIRRGLIGGGVAFVVVGTGMMALSAISASPDYDDYVDRHDEREGASLELKLLFGGLGLVGVGTLGAYAGTRIDPHPIEPHEAREIVERYNQRLLNELELEKEDFSEDDSDGLRVHDLQLSPFVDLRPDGGLVIGGRF